jgi:hypothetical protein
MALNSLYRNYFQKSKVFLYPLLGINRGSSVVPQQTYFSWGTTIKSEDKKLICSYPNRTDSIFESFNSKVLINHTRLVDIYAVNKDESIYIFDFNDLEYDWTNIINGQYSKIDKNLKQKILNFFKNNHGNYLYIESYLYPEKHFKTYAELLNVNIELLISVGELCSKPDYEKECLMLPYPNLDILDNNSNIVDIKNQNL